MVGGDVVDRPVQQPLPEQLSVAALADRGAALVRRAPVRDLLGHQGQIVRAGLDGDVQTVGLGRGQHGQRVGGGQVQDVGPGLGPPGSLDHLGDGQVLRSPGPGGQEPLVNVALGLGGPVDGPRVLGVHDHQGVVGGEHPQVLLQLVTLQVRELVDAGMQQEALEAEHTVVVQPAEVVDVAGHGTAPEPEVDERLALGDQPLELQGRLVHRGRDRVQRHVDHRGHPTGRRRLGGGGETLPVRPPRLVDVHVGVDQTGDQRLVVGQRDHLGALQPVPVRLDGDDLAVPDAHLPVGDPGRGEDPASLDHQLVRGRALARRGFGRSVGCGLVPAELGDLLANPLRTVDLGDLRRVVARHR